MQQKDVYIFTFILLVHIFLFWKWDHWYWEISVTTDCWFLLLCCWWWCVHFSFFILLVWDYFSFVYMVILIFIEFEFFLLAPSVGLHLWLMYKFGFIVVTSYFLHLYWLQVLLYVILWVIFCLQHISPGLSDF